MNDSQNISDAPSGDETQASSATGALLASAPDSEVRILESIPDAFFALDSEWRFTYLNAQAERLILRTRTDVLGRSIWDEFPESIGSTFEREYRRAVSEGSIVSFEQFYPPLSLWFNVRAYPANNGLSVFFQDVSERVERERRERFLTELAERARRLTNPEDVIADALRSTGEFLGVSRCIFADIDIEADTCSIHPHYRADETVQDIEGVVPISAFGAFVVAEYAERRAVVVEDARVDPIRVPPASLGAYEAFGILAHITVPVVHSDRVVSCISVHNATARRWKPEEVELLRTVVERTWLTVEVTRQQRAAAREAEERREAHARTARILESITDAFFTTDREWRYTYINPQVEALWQRSRTELLGMTVWEAWPEAIGSAFDHQFHRAMDQGVSVSFEEFFPPLEAWLEVRVYPSEDGISVFFQNVSARKRAEEALRESEARYRLLVDSSGEGIYGINIEGCFTFVNQASAQMLGFTPAQIIGQSGHGLIHHSRPDGAPYPETECPIYRALHSGQSVHEENDVFWRADGTSFPVAYSAAPIIEQETVHGVVVTFSDISERKALDAERERIVERERNIAQQLQNALQPPLPLGVAGLKLAKYYEAALDEAGVGGDFFDCFPIKKGCTMLSVGDLSGKGLMAAAQVSTVRNMLRAFLYSKPTLAEAVTDLNRVIALNGLLSGFATLWVGCYDGFTGKLTYVNLGQEPALVRRVATGEIEQLPPTGPVLGADENGSYEERTLMLSPGDALAVFTDGATECGMNRQEMLGIEGVAALLKPSFIAEEIQSAEQMAEALALRLVEGVDAAARGGVAKDDLCILVAVAEGASLGRPCSSLQMSAP